MSDKKSKKLKDFELPEIFAKKDFIINHNNYYCAIKKGDNIVDLGVPKKYYVNLVTEGVINDQY